MNPKLDHVEIFVPDRETAAGWYGRVLGFEILEEFRGWAVPDGPLILSNDDGDTKLALFVGTAQGSGAVRGLRRVAFRADAAGFVRFLQSSGRWRDQALASEDVVDHERAVSVYFTDPWGNLLEVTCYEADAVRAALGGEDSSGSSSG